MNQTLKLKASDLPHALRSIDGYKGRTFRAEVTTSVLIPDDAGLCSGGTRQRFFAVHLETRAVVDFTPKTAPWSLSRVDQRVELRPGFLVVERSHFLGKDCGLRFYVHPSDVALALPAAKEGGAS